MRSRMSTGNGILRYIHRQRLTAGELLRSTVVFVVAAREHHALMIFQTLA
jgi:hypothetical protein